MNDGREGEEEVRIVKDEYREGVTKWDVRVETLC